MDSNFQPTTFRFKFSEEFQEHLNAFAKLHRYDNRHDFKESWAKWIDDQSSLVDSECNTLKKTGYNGSPIDKMYKSARYYFRKKSDTKDQPKKRRKYVSLDQRMIDLMDTHIMDWCRRADFKPSYAFDDFCEKYDNQITDEITRLFTQKGLTESDISEKFKKTYKNRYFQKVKSQC